VTPVKLKRTNTVERRIIAFLRLS